MLPVRTARVVIETFDKVCFKFHRLAFVNMCMLHYIICTSTIMNTCCSTTSYLQCCCHQSDGFIDEFNTDTYVSCCLRNSETLYHKPNYWNWYNCIQNRVRHNALYVTALNSIQYKEYSLTKERQIYTSSYYNVYAHTHYRLHMKTHGYHLKW